MESLDLILAKLGAAWNVATKYFEHPELIFAVAVVILIISLAAINRRH